MEPVSPSKETTYKNVMAKLIQLQVYSVDIRNVKRVGNSAISQALSRAFTA